MKVLISTLILIALPLLAIIAFPQLIGILLFLRLRRFAHWSAHVLGFITPILLSAGFAWLIYLYRYYQLNPDDRCGGQALGATLIIFFVAGMQVLIGALAQTAVHARSNRCRGKVS